MKYTHLSIIYALLITGCTVAFTAPAKQSELAAKVSKLVMEYFPDAVVTQDNEKLSAKHGTMVFTIHRHWRTGKILEETDQVEGPNYDGFMISISVEDGMYIGPAMVPQTLNRRYWKEYIDRPSLEDGSGYYVINFAYGSRLDKDFMSAIFKVLPVSKIP